MKQLTARGVLPLLAVLLLLWIGLPALAQDGLGQTFVWTAKGLSIGYPDGWTPQELTGDILVLLSDPADAAALSLSDTAPTGPLVALLMTADLSAVGMTEGPTLTATLDNWAADTANASFAPAAADKLLELEAASASGETQVAGVTLLIEAYLTELSDGQYLMLLAIQPSSAEAFPATLEAMLASLVVAGVNDSGAEATPVPQQDGGDGLAETFSWETKGLLVDHPAGWAAQVLTTLSPDILALASSTGDINMLLAGADAPAGPVVVLILSADVNSIMGPGSFAEDATLQAKLELLAERNLSGPPQIVETTLAGLAALRADGPGSNDLFYALVVAETAAGEDLLALAAIPAGQADSFASTLEAVLASVRFAEAEPAQQGGDAAASGLSQSFRWLAADLTVFYPAGWAVSSLDIGATALLSNPADDPQEAPTAPAVLLLPLANLPGFELESGAQPDVIIGALAELIGGGVTGGVERLIVAGYFAARTQFVTDSSAFDVVVLLAGETPLAIIGVAPPAQAADLTAVFDPILAAVSASAQATPAPLTPTVIDLPQGPADPLAYEVAGAVTLVEPPDIPPHRAFYAPDGIHYVYAQDRDVICRSDINQTQETCVSVPREMTGGGTLTYDTPFLPARPTFDGARIAIVGLPYRFYNDSDLVVVDFDSGSVINLADDGYADDLVLSDAPNTPVIVDIQPAWSPDGRFIATERAVRTSDGFEPAHIMVIDAESGAVRELTLLPFLGGGDNPPDAGTTMDLAWSPDGTRIAATFRHFQQSQHNSLAHGLFIIDVATGEMDLLVSYADVHNALVAGLGLPSDEFPIEERLLPYYLGSLQWSPDGTRLMFWSENPQYAATSASRQPLWVDVESGDLHTLPLPRHPDDPRPDMQFVAPYQSAWSPDGRTVLLVTHELRSLPGETVIPLAGEESGQRALRLLDPATGAMRLLGHLPPAPSWPGSTIWTPEGNVFASGYALQLLPQ